jgi:hypothetical protein
MLAEFGLVVALALQAATPSDWKTHAPSSAGWRTVTLEMTVDDVARVLPGELGPPKRENYTDGTTGLEVKLKKKVHIDGIDYEVRFGFDAARRLRSIVFFSNKVKKETSGGVVAAFTDLRGQPTSREQKAFPDGGTLDRTVWQDGEITLSVNYATTPLGGFVTGRIVTVVMNVKKAS